MPAKSRLANLEPNSALPSVLSITRASGSLGADYINRMIITISFTITLFTVYKCIFANFLKNFLRTQGSTFSA